MNTPRRRPFRRMPPHTLGAKLPVILLVLSIATVAVVVSVYNNGIQDGDVLSDLPEEADVAWAHIWSTEHLRDTRADGSLNFFSLAQKQKHHIRRAGMEFWRAFPDDARRYEWLLTSVLIPPEASADRGDTFLESTSLSCWETPGRAREAQWESAFPDMYREFSQNASLRQKRALHHAQIIGLITEFKRALHCESADSTKIEGQVLALASSYFDDYPPSTEFGNSSDERTDLYAVLSLVQFAIQSSGGSAEEFEDYLIQLQATAEHADWVDEARSILVTEADNLAWSPGMDSQFRDLIAWEWLPDEYELSRYSYFLRRLIEAREDRIIGIALWDQIDSDTLRFRWVQDLSNTFEHFAFAVDPAEAASALVADINATFATNEEDIANWEDFRKTLDRFLDINPTGASEEDIARIRSLDVRTQLAAAHFRDRVAGGNSHVKSILPKIVQIYRVYGDTRMAIRFASTFTKNPESYNLTDTDVEWFVTDLRESGIPELVALADGRDRRKDLRQKPMSFSAPLLDGGSFNVSDLRGQIVLLEFWSLNCASCISAMPKLHETFLRYKDSGFQIVSVSFDGDSNPKRVRRIIDDLALTWKVVNAESQWENLNIQYGWGNTVPQYMLLDRKGYLVADKYEIDRFVGGLDRLVAEHLADSDNNSSDRPSIQSVDLDDIESH